MLTIDRLIEANVTRTERDFNHKLTDWSIMEWGAACAGEVGEACNVAKKLRRRQMGMERFNKAGESEFSLQQKLADEIADCIHYAVLWAVAADIDLEEALRSKFNRISAIQGSSVRL